MDLTSIGKSVFDAMPSWVTTTVVFSRKSLGSFAPTTDKTTYSSQTDSNAARCTVQGAKGTLSESFIDALMVRQKYLILTVVAADLGTFYPKAGDVATMANQVFKVTGVEAVGFPLVAVFRVTVER